MLVKIVKSSESTHWYNNKINETFNVKRYDNHHYTEMYNSLRLIKKNDCVIINQDNSISQECYIEQQMKKINLFIEFLKDRAPYFVPDWETTQPKYYVYLSHEYKCWSIGQDIIDDTAQIYMPLHVCQELINKLNVGEISA